MQIKVTGQTKIFIDSDQFDRIVGYCYDSVFDAKKRGLAKFYCCPSIEKELGEIPPRKAERRRVLVAGMEKLPDNPIPRMAVSGRVDSSPHHDARGDVAGLTAQTVQRDQLTLEDVAHVMAAESVKCHYMVTQRKVLEERLKLQGSGLKPISRRDLEHMLTILISGCYSYHYLTDSEFEYLYPHFYRKGDIWRMESELPRIPAAKRQHGIPARDGEEFKLIFEEQNSDWGQGVHLDTDRTITVDGTTYKRGVIIFHGAKYGMKSPELSIAIRSKEGMLWVHHVWDHRPDEVTEPPGSIMTSSRFSGMLIDELPNGYRYRCNDGWNDDDYDELIFRIERMGSSGDRKKRNEAGPRSGRG
jgi:hypothetical protein